MTRNILTIILILLAGWSAAAQTGVATISGRIVDESGPLEGVTVVAIHQTTNAQYYTTTGRGGWYQLLDVLPGGPYTVRIHYFDYKPLTVRGLYTFAGQNVVVDADLEQGRTHVRSDEAATSLRLGPGLGGGAVPVSPLGFDLVAQRICTPVVFDVRQEASLDGAATQWTVPTGSNRLHGSAYGFFGPATDVFGRASALAGHFGLNVATPLGSEDYQLFAGGQYSLNRGLDAAVRFDGRIDQAKRIELTGGRLAGADAWATGAFTSQTGERGSNRVQAGWSGFSDAAFGVAGRRQLLVADDFTYAAGRQRLLAGVQFAYTRIPSADSAAARFDFYVQDAVRLGRRLTVTGGMRFTFPFAFSPRVSVSYDVLGTGALVLRAGSAVYGRAGEGTVWKNLAAIDTRLPLKFLLTLEAVYGQSWLKAFHISSRNVLDSRYALTARLERPLANRFWAVASYTRSDGPVTDRLFGGFSYRAEYLGRFATTASLRYTGYNYHGPDPLSSLYPAPMRNYWMNDIEALLSQDFSFEAGGRVHTLQLTGYLRLASDHVLLSPTRSCSEPTSILIGIRYLL